jgi:hypothetical protein
MGVLSRTGTYEQDILSTQKGGAGHGERRCHSQFPA